jgi:hypothetical protein
VGVITRISLDTMATGVAGASVDPVDPVHVVLGRMAETLMAERTIGTRDHWTEGRSRKGDGGGKRRELEALSLEMKRQSPRVSLLISPLALTIRLEAHFEITLAREQESRGRGDGPGGRGGRSRG